MTHRKTSTIFGLIGFEWKYTYRSARRDGYTRQTSFRKFVREIAKGIPQMSKP